MKSAKKLILGLLAFTGLCVVCAVFGAVTYSAGKTSQATTGPGPAQAVALPTSVKKVEQASDTANTGPKACAVKMEVSVGGLNGTLYEVATGPGHNTLCQKTMENAADMQTDPGIQLELSIIDYDPGLTAYCQREFGPLKVELQSDDELIATQFCANFLEQ